MCVFVWRVVQQLKYGSPVEHLSLCLQVTRNVVWSDDDRPLIDKDKCKARVLISAASRYLSHKYNRLRTRWSDFESHAGILQALVKSREATISFLASVLSVRIEHLGSHWTDFHKIWYLSIFRKFVEKITVSLKYDKNSGYFTWRPVYIYDNTSPNSLLQAKVLEKVKTHFIWNNFFSRKSCRLWDNVEKYGNAGQATDDNRRMRLGLWISQATDTLWICYIYCFSKATMVMQRRLYSTLYVHCLSCLILRQNHVLHFPSKQKMQCLYFKWIKA